MSKDRTIDYVELPGRDMAAMKAFYGETFGWEFVDYGPAYAAFDAAQAGVDGGFDIDGQELSGPLVVLYADDLEGMLAAVEAAGGTVIKPIFSFPGGRRFHFTDPAGNVLAVWTKA
ncbi:VOC family protein [Caulobacter sp. 17J80-11]|uniref:VOC family protein n=1 Tax=Caulobacter sp. 17J80-11 TaxID=2763502 RepID=UPI001653C248|nr:VOC family protein [Caulobacter sp. 17J80-11]MBC6983084.1 VOC family protein [Caulobacter sp. 17J80-11]